MFSSAQASRQAWDFQAEPLSESTRSIVMPRAANQDTARSSTPIAVDLGIGDAGVVVDDGVHECFPDQRFPVFTPRHSRSRRSVPVALLPADETVSAAVGYVAELRHIDMDHRTGFVVLVTPGDLAGAFVNMVETVQPQPYQDRVDGRGRHVELPADADRSQALFPAQMPDPAHQLRRGPVRTAMRARGPVLHPHRAHRRITVGPPLRGRPRHVELVGGIGDRPSIVNDQTRDPKTVTWSQSSISVGHEGLLVEAVV
ncbi:hypothetical protein IWX88_000866 [Frigoribacterium sp. CG_9.8]|nr:hypothetical protein [Frigoribacterium sp. CG_9.8]